MRSVKQLIEDLRRHSSYLDWAEDGRSPEDIKSHAEGVLVGYFSDPKTFGSIPLPALAHEAASVELLQDDPWAAAMFEAVLEEYRAAASVDQEASFAAVAGAEPAVLRGISEFMSLFLMENDKADLGLEELRLEAFRNIGGLVEACIKPQLQALLHQVRIRRGKAASTGDVARLKLGNVVRELSDTLEAPELVAPPPWGLSLSQWRNIAQHHDSWVEGDFVVCRYEEGSLEKIVRLTRAELVAAIERIHRVLGAIRTARSIVVLDNVEQLRGRFEPCELRPEISLFELAVAMATQGFEVVDFVLEEDAVALSVLDVTSDSSARRMVHASQFVVPVWQTFPRQTVVVKYVNGDGSIGLTATATGADCEVVGSGLVPFHELAERISLELADGTRA